MIVTILIHSTHTDKTLVKDIPHFDILKTIKDKENSPLWNFTNTPDRTKSALTLGGMVIDYDDITFPKLKKEYHYYYHRTHSNKFRIIIPFDRVYNYTTEAEYQDQYMELLYTMFGNPTVDGLFADKILQKCCCTSNRYFFMRPEQEKLEYSEGSQFYKPDFKINSKEDFKREVARLGKRISYEFAPHEVCQAILLRMYNFYTYYGDVIDWEFINTQGVCKFDWHDSSKSGCMFNNPTHLHKATIDCKHATCEDKLIDFMHQYQFGLPEKGQKSKGPALITCKTVLYLAAAILKGRWSKEEIEACGFYSYKNMRDQIERLQRLQFNSKIDAVNWVKIYHQNAVLHPESQEVYCYEDHVYKEKSEALLKNEYEYTVGTYYAYRTRGLRMPAPKTYVDDLGRYAKAYMLENFKSLKTFEHLNLNNGILKFDTDNGTYDFLPHSRKVFSRIKLDYEYDPKAQCPLWFQTLIDYFDNLESPQVLTLQEYFGYCLTYDRSLEKLCFIFGASRGGKNTIAQTLLHLVGGGECSMDFLITPERRSTTCHNKKVVFVDEMPVMTSPKVVNELKKISSTDGMEMRLLHRQPYITHEVPKLLIAFNDLPENFKIDRALRNRMLAVKFIKTFQGNENTLLKEQLRLELAGILNWALKGYQKIYKNRYFVKYTSDASELYHLANEEMYDMYEFLQVKKKEAILWKTTDLLNAYQHETGDFKISQMIFFKRVRSFKIKRTYRNGYRFYDLTSVE